MMLVKKAIPVIALVALPACATVTPTGVQGTMAHIHRGARGTNGGVAIGLAKSGDTYTVPDGTKLSDADQAAFKAGNLYVNVHSAANKGGEIRAQIQP